MDKEEGQALADVLGALFIETSAKQVYSVYPDRSWIDQDIVD